MQPNRTPRSTNRLAAACCLAPVASGESSNSGEASSVQSASEGSCVLLEFVERLSSTTSSIEMQMLTNKYVRTISFSQVRAHFYIVQQIVIIYTKINYYNVRIIHKLYCNQFFAAARPHQFIVRVSCAAAAIQRRGTRAGRRGAPAGESHSIFSKLKWINNWLRMYIAARLKKSTRFACRAPLQNGSVNSTSIIFKNYVIHGVMYKKTRKEINTSSLVARQPAFIINTWQLNLSIYLLLVPWGTYCGTLRYATR